MAADPDRLLKLEEAIEPSFIALARTARARGYSDAEVADALLSLAVARVLALKANVDTEDAIREAIRRVHGTA